MSGVTIRSPISQEARADLIVHSDLVASLLSARGIQTQEEAARFIAPDYERDSHDPYLLKDMDRAVARIIAAIEAQEHIVIYSDYDMDGIPGAVALGDFFKKIGYKNYTHYIPHRNREGFGLNIPAIEQLSKQGANMIITVDHGIGAVKETERAQELGIDVIVTDHHLPHETLPPAYAVIDHKRTDCTYPEKILCGAGVAFKLVQALVRSGHWDIPAGWEKWLLDMVGMATIADMVPLTGENRMLAYYGLVVLRKSKRPGLRALLAQAKVDQRNVTEDDVGFSIAPRINAASRMGVPMDAFKLLATDDEAEAQTLALHLNKINDERKGHVAVIAKEIKKRIGLLGDVRDVIVMGNPQWKPSLLGLVASSVVEEYKRPVFLWGREEGTTIKGSCRSDGSSSVVAIMAHASDSFIEYGGHVAAGGFSVKDEMIHTLEHVLIEGYERAPRDVGGTGRAVDMQLSLGDVTHATWNMISALAPFGEGNPKPLFLFEHLTVEEVRMFGKGSEHLELTLRDGHGDTAVAIGFFMNPEQFETKVETGSVIDLIATVEQSNFRGRRSIRLRIVDVM
jgi:single-stranded-DNA-specific exonuclease